MIFLEKSKPNMSLSVLIFCFKIPLLVSMLPSTDERLPMVKEKNTHPQYIQIMLSKNSL